MSHADAEFGTSLPIMSSGYSPLREAMSAMSAAQASGFQTGGLSSVNKSLSRILASDIYSRPKEAVAARTLLEVAKILSHPLQNWRSLVQKLVSFINDLAAHGTRGNFPQAAARLTLRFGRLRA